MSLWELSSEKLKTQLNKPRNSSVLYPASVITPLQMTLHTWYVEARGLRVTVSRLNGAVNGSHKVVVQRPTSRIFHPVIRSVFVSHCDLTKTREVGHRPTTLWELV